VLKLQRQEIGSALKAHKADLQLHEVSTDRATKELCIDSLRQERQQQEAQYKQALERHEEAFRRAFANHAATNTKLTQMTQNFREAQQQHADQKLEQDRLERQIEAMRREVQAEQDARARMVAGSEELRRQNEILEEENKNKASQLQSYAPQKAEEIAIQKQKTDQAQEELATVRLSAEEAWSRTYRAQEKLLKMKAAHEKLGAETRFLSRKCIAVLVHRGWTRARLKAVAEQHSESRTQIADQREVLAKNEERLHLLGSLRAELEQGKADLARELQQTTMELGLSEKKVKERD